MDGGVWGEGWGVSWELCEGVNTEQLGGMVWRWGREFDDARLLEASGLEVMSFGAWTKSPVIHMQSSVFVVCVARAGRTLSVYHRLSSFPI